MVGGGHFPALQLGCCLPVERHEAGTGAGAVQARITNAEGTDGRHTVPFPQSAHKEQQGYLQAEQARLLLFQHLQT